MSKSCTRRDFLTSSSLLTLSFLAGCSVPSPSRRMSPLGSIPIYTQQQTAKGKHVLRLFAPSGFGKDYAGINLAISRLQNAGFTVNNIQAAYRQSGRFAGTDRQRAADLQDIAAGRVQAPEVLLAVRGGYGAMRILRYIDWASLGSCLREKGTILMGYSDITAIQLALLAQGHMMCSFAGPMLMEGFGKPEVSAYTLSSFVQCLTHSAMNISVSQGATYGANHSVEGIFWGGNLSLLAALTGTPYMPNIRGGILFIEEVGEHTYRIERMLQTLYLSNILAQQKAIVIGTIQQQYGTVDEYDTNYTLASLFQRIQQLTKVPVFTGLPFGHIANHVTMPLGVAARITSQGFGYQVSFDHYPSIRHSSDLNFSALSQSPVIPTDGEREENAKPAAGSVDVAPAVQWRVVP